MRLYLTRHFESIKNKRATLSKDADTDVLTDQGRRRAAAFAQALLEEMSFRHPAIATIFASSSARSWESAKILADTIGVDDVRSCDFLRSTGAGPYAGYSLAKIRRLNREWYDMLQLYRAGLFNQYKFDEPPLAIGAETKSNFEQRVLGGFLPTLNDPKGRSILIVAGRSPLTAIMLYFAREYYSYPRDFYGYVPIALGSVSILTRCDDGTWKFEKVNSRFGRSYES